MEPVDEVKDLAVALKAYLKSRGRELSNDPMDNVSIPVKGITPGDSGDTCLLPVLFLETAP